MVAADKRSGPEGPPRVAAAKEANNTRILADAETHRRRQVQRLAVIALMHCFYGPVADVRLVPPGPACCPDHCPYCFGAA